MQHIDFYYDCISPYAYLAFEALPEALLGLGYSVRYRPILFGALLKHHGQLGPAEIQPKRDWTYRQVAWLAERHRLPLQFPAMHPFNPLALLRLAVGCGREGATNRFVTEAVLRHVWVSGGADPIDPQRLQALAERLAPAQDVQGEAVKAQLKANTDEAIARGLFGVPTMVVQGADGADRLFWGFDALPMLREFLEGGDWFGSGAWERMAQVPQGLQRQRPGPAAAKA